MRHAPRSNRRRRWCGGAAAHHPRAVESAAGGTSDIFLATSIAVVCSSKRRRRKRQRSTRKGSEGERRRKEGVRSLSGPRPCLCLAGQSETQRKKEEEKRGARHLFLNAERAGATGFTSAVPHAPASQGEYLVLALRAWCACGAAVPGGVGRQKKFIRNEIGDERRDCCGQGLRRDTRGVRTVGLERSGGSGRAS